MKPITLLLNFKKFQVVIAIVRLRIDILERTPSSVIGAGADVTRFLGRLK